MPNFVVAAVAAAAGGALALMASFGLVYSQTSAPSSNPANQPILVYGSR